MIMIGVMKQENTKINSVTSALIKKSVAVGKEAKYDHIKHNSR